MIVGNEEALLPDALRSVRGVVAEVIVMVGTDSTDRTWEIARSMGARVSSFGWCDDFAAARNAALELATSTWVLALDADDRLLPKGVTAIREAVYRKTPLDGHGLVIEECALDGTVLMTSTSNVRLFRKQPGVRYFNRAHEEVRLNGQRDAGKWSLLSNGPHVRHFGYDPTLVRDRRKDERVLRLLTLQLEEHPRDQPTMYRLARHHSSAGRPSEAKAWASRCLLADLELSQLLPGERVWIWRINQTSGIV